jgi:hypothetical protein
MRSVSPRSRRSIWPSVGLAALILFPFAVRYALVRYRLERDIEATERQQREWNALDRSEGETMKPWIDAVRDDVLRSREASTRPVSQPAPTTPGPEPQ